MATVRGVPTGAGGPAGSVSDPREGAGPGGANPSEWGERPLDESNIRNRLLAPCLREAGLRHIRLHDLRHTFASLLFANGEGHVYVKDQLGHHRIQITVDTYGYFDPWGK